MRVLINIFSALGQRTGVGHYSAELFRSLQEQTSVEEIAPFPQGLAWRAGRAWAALRPWLSKGDRRVTPPALPQQRKGFSPGRWFRQKTLVGLRSLGQAYLAGHLRRLIARQRYELYHETNAIPMPCDCLTVTTVHDLSPLLYPQWHPPSRVAFFRQHFLPALECSQHFLTDSAFIRQEMIQSIGIRAEKITCVPLGVRRGLGLLPSSATAAALRQLGLPPQYLLHVGTIEPRKNLLMLLRAYCGLPSELRCRWPLLLIGGWGWACSDVAEYYHAEARHLGVQHVGYLPDAYLAAVYNGARALLFPSCYEGFGLPGIEMLACGGAVLVSTAGALVETVGSCAHLLDPHDIDSWRQAMARVLQDDDWRQELRQGAIEAARPFTWSRCAAETLNVYRALLQRDIPQQRPKRTAA